MIVGHIQDLGLNLVGTINNGKWGIPHMVAHQR